MVPGEGFCLGSGAGYDFVHGGFYCTVPAAGCGLALVQRMLRYMLESMVWYLVEGMVWYLVKGMFGTC